MMLQGSVTKTKLEQAQSLFKGNYLLVARWPLACLLIAVFIIVCIDIRLTAQRAEIEQEAQQEALTLARSYADRINQTASQINQSLLAFKFIAERSYHGVDLQQQVRAGLFPIADTQFIMFVSAAGMIVASTAEELIGKNIADNPVFREHRDHQVQRMRLGVGEINYWRPDAVRFSHRLNNADGSFAGTVVLAVRPDHLASFSELALRKVDFSALMTHEGVVIAAKTPGGVDKAQPYRIKPKVDRFVEHKAMRLDNTVFQDFMSRIVAWSPVRDFPLVASVAFNDQLVFERFEREATVRKRLALFLVVILAVVGITGALHTMRSLAKRERDNEMTSTYRLANEGALEGFYTLEPVLDEMTRIVDFLIIDCNERGANFFAMSTPEMVGSRMSDILPGLHFETFFKCLNDAIITGFHESELEVKNGSPMLPAAVQMRLAKHGHCIAVTLRDISETKHLKKKLWQAEHADQLTGLPNRKWVLNRFPHHFAVAKSRFQSITFAHIDFDNFKRVNSILGHNIGDQLLRTAGMRLKTLMRDGDHLVRLGGDEFAIILYNIGHDETDLIAKRIMARMCEPYLLDDRLPTSLTVSLGLASFPQDGSDVETLVRHADIAMHAAKVGGKSRYVYFAPSLLQTVTQKLDTENTLRRAMDEDRLYLHFQPRVNVHTGEIVSMEALVRLRDREGREIPPDVFIPVAETAGLIMRLGEIVLRKTCQQIAAWREQGVPCIPVSVNVTATQFAHGCVRDSVLANMAKYDIAPGMVELELTESCMLDDNGEVADELNSIRALGVLLLVDDFGTGYSSLAQLQKLPLDILKIDKSFTDKLTSGLEAEVFFQAMLTMASSLNMRVVAEGVETMAQLNILKRMNCAEIQGYLFSKPVPPHEMANLILERVLHPVAVMQRPRLV